jgi:dTDP-L-rhamnose 4-epimerase
MTELGTQRVLVTGGAGFIGCALARRLAPQVAEWVVLDSLHPQVHQQNTRPAELHESARLVVGDVTDPVVWDSLLAEFSPTVVIHLAAETGTAQSLDEATRHAHVNVVGTTAMLDALGRHGVVPERFLLSSSRAVYGEGAWRSGDGATFYPGQRSHAQFEAGQWDFAGATPVPSTAAATIPRPTSVYGATKLAQENILSAWVNARDTSLTVLRLQNVYGPGQSLVNSYTGIVSLFSQLAEVGRSIPLYEDGAITRDFVYIDDVADAFVAALALPGGGPTPTFDIGSGVGTTIAQLAESIAAYYGAPAPHITAKFRDGDVRHAECRIDESLAGLDWAPRWSLDAGVAGLQEWMATQPERTI